MVQLIGIMIGAYIFTRMVEITLDKSKGVALGILAIFTALITLACMAGLLIAGSSVATGY